MQKTAHLPNINIAYTVDGEGTSAVVFLHGDGQRGAMGRHLLDAFPATHKKITIDRPGHGNSTDIPSRTIEAETKIIAHILIQEKITDVILIGHSSGAAIAAAYACNHPVRALVLSNPLFCDPHKIFWYLPLSFLERTYLKKAESNYGKNNLTGNEKTESELQKAVFGVTPTTTLRANLRALDGFDVRNSLKDIIAPTLIIQSTHGLLSLARHIRRVAGDMQNVIVETIPNETHNFLLLKKEKAKEIIQTRLSFLRA